jgi:hypothetical protein
VDDDEIRRIIDELDAAVSKDNAELIIHADDLEQPTFECIGNRKGYLRAGIELLRAAVVPMGAAYFITPVDIDYLIRNVRSLHVGRLTRQENLEAALPPVKKRTWKNKAAGMGCITVILILAGCTFVGIGQALYWIFGK